MSSHLQRRDKTKMSETIGRTAPNLCSVTCLGEWLAFLKSSQHTQTQCPPAWQKTVADPFCNHWLCPVLNGLHRETGNLPHFKTGHSWSFYLNCEPFKFMNPFERKPLATNVNLSFQCQMKGFTIVNPF